MTTRTHLGSTDPQWPGPEAVRKTFPPRWLTVIVVLALGAGTLAGGLLTGEQLLVGVGIGLVATGALILLGFKVKSVNVAGLISLEIDLDDVGGPEPPG